MRTRNTLASLLICWAMAHQGHAVFISPPPLAEAVAEAKWILRVVVLEETGAYKVGGEEFFKICRCKIAARLKTADDLPDSGYQTLNEVFIACPAKTGFGTLGKGDDCVVFCVAGGYVLTVLNGGYIYAVEDGHVRVKESSLPGAAPDKEGWRSIAEKEFTDLVSGLVRARGE